MQGSHSASLVGAPGTRAAAGGDVSTTDIVLGESGDGRIDAGPDDRISTGMIIAILTLRSQFARPAHLPDPTQWGRAELPRGVGRRRR
jgi:hypothetical protein